MSIKLMKKILIVMSIALISMGCLAGQKRLSNGSVVFWPENTSIIEYNSYCVQVELTDECDFNVVGTVYLKGQAGDRHSQNFIISAGEKKTDVHFDNLKNGCRYYIEKVVIL